MREHPAESIDAFLESRQHLRETMSRGRVLIAVLMGQAIAVASPERHTKTDWLGYVIEKMRKGAPTWEKFAEGNAHVRFVTFNFDTFIEERLYSAVRAIYRNSDMAKATVLQSTPVMHVHGALPAVTDEAREHLKRIASGDVNTGATAWITTAAQSINIALEEIPSETLAPMRDAVQRRGIVCFLGFAYDPVNLLKLGLPPRLNTVPLESQIFGSACGLLEGEKAAVRRYFNNRITLGGHDQECREILRALEVFQD